MKKIVCHDCGKALKGNDEFMPYEVAGETFAKCKKCHQADATLRNYRKTEVYSRVVGYIRPVNQWNTGKKEEYKDRTEFVVADAACGC